MHDVTNSVAIFSGLWCELKVDFVFCLLSKLVQFQYVENPFIPLHIVPGHIFQPFVPTLYICDADKNDGRPPYNSILRAIRSFSRRFIRMTISVLGELSSKNKSHGLCTKRRQVRRGKHMYTMHTMYMAIKVG